MKSVLLDRDILFDYLRGEEGRAAQSIEVIRLCKSGRIKGWISEGTISGLFKFFSQTTDRTEKAKKIKDLLEFLSVLPSSKENIVRTLSATDEDYERIIQVESAKAARFDYFVTKDVPHYKAEIKIITPEGLLDELADDEVISSIPALDLTRELHEYWNEVQGELTNVAFSTNFIMGDGVKKFEDRFAKYCKVEHSVAVASGSDALLLSLMAIDAGPGDAVITTPYTFFATAGAISRLFALPVFVDIDSSTYNIDAEKIERLIETSCDWDGENLWIELPKLKTSFWNPEYFPARRRIKAIIPVHLFGQTADMERIMEIARKYNLYVVEDAAQAHGAECWIKSDNGDSSAIYNSKHATIEQTLNNKTNNRIGSIGHFGCFSVFPTKNLGCWGDGGAVTTSDPVLAEKVRVLRVHGSKPKYYHKLVGINSRLDTMQAAVLLAKLPYMDRWIEKRQEVASRYLDLLSTNENIALPEVAGYTARHVWNQFVVRIYGDGKRNDVQNKLKDKGIGTGIYYPLPLHLQECFSYLGYTQGDFPNSERAALETLALPMYPELERKEQEEISKRLGEVL